jgi:putative thiamine transport system substrate-binding protein
MMADGEIDLAISFDPGEASAAIAADELPPTVRTFAPQGGSIGNASFVAIPFNAAAREGAMVLADFLLSPQAQARKQDPAVWGGFTVLALDRLDEAGRALFDALDLGPATLSPDELGPPLPEPHPAWMERLAADWAARHGAGR